MARKFKYFFILATLIYSCIGNPDSDFYVKRYVHNFDRIYGIGQKISRIWTAPYFESLLPEANLTLNCQKSLRILFRHPEREWAALMLDANGRLLKPGFLSGTITDYGDYDQCMAISHEDQTVPDNVIHGRYCLMTLRPPLPPPNIRLDFSNSSYSDSWPSKWFGHPRNRFYFRLVSAICFPSQCRSDEMERLARKVFEDFELTVQVEACQTNGEPKRLDFAQKFSILVLSICAGATIVGSVVDWYYRRQCEENKNPDLFRQLCIDCSLIRNTELLFTIKSDSGESELKPIHGLRFLLIMWVICCHTTNFAPLALYDQPMIASRFAERINIVKEFWTQFIISGSLSVQAFFIISGLISLHTTLKNPEIFSKSVPYWKYVFLRWFRFAPPLLGMFCYQFLWPLLGSGPMMHWDYLRYGHQPCYQSWWTNFLFVSNWLKLVDQCGSHTWFLSADFQINLVAYFFILLYVIRPDVGFWINILALAVATVMPTIINWYYGVPLVHILEQDVEKLNIAFNMIEFNTYNHFAAYLAGLLLASMLQDRKFSVSKGMRTVFWWSSLILVLIIPFSTYPFIQLDEIPQTFLPMIYTGVKRTLWISAIGWIIYGSCTENCIVARILSAKIFQPFSRLTFCIYLTQSLVVWYYAYQSRELHTISHYNSIFRIGGVTLFSLIFAFWLHVLFEAPSVNICRTFFKRHRNQVNENDSNNNEKQEQQQVSLPKLTNKSSLKID